MSLNPSWKWLPSRPTAQQMAQSAGETKAQSRPCLPVIEQLGDRVMLSGDTEVIINPGEKPQVAIDQILIGLLKGELQDSSTELSLQKIVANVDPKLTNKFTAGLIKIDNVLYGATEDLIKGKLTEQKIQKAIETISSEFVKIDALVGGLPKLGDIKIVLDEMENKATDFLGALSKIDVVNELTDKERQTFVKITDAFGDLDAGLLKLQEDLVSAKTATGQHIKKGQLQYLEIKLQDILVSSRQLGDEAGTLKESILGTVGDYEKILIGLLQPPDTDTDVITIE